MELTIALGFAADEVSVEAEVLWRRYRDGADTVYGMAFCEPTPQVYEEINRTIQERCEGRVLEWELPWIPEESRVERFSWRAMVLGVAVGLAGAVGALGLTGLDHEEVAAPTAAKGIRAIATGTAVIADASPESSAVTNELAATNSSEAASPTPPPAKVAPEKPTIEAKPAVEPPVFQVPASVVAQIDQTPKASESKVIEMAAPVTEEAAAVEAIGPAWEAVDGKVQFRIPLDQGADGVKWFALSAPNRLVVDVHSGSTPLVKKAYDIEHPWLNSLRVGRYEAKTRFVFDIGDGVKFDGDPKVTTSGDWVTMTFMR